jgi:SPP1 gp7 family putative phage head morphogenesis protein
MSDPRQLAFWEGEEAELWNAMYSLIMVTVMDGVKEGVEGLPANYRVLADWNVVNKDALHFARTYRYDLIKKITDTTRETVIRAITDWINEGSPLDALTARLEPIFGDVRAEMIAITETTRAYAQGNQIAWESTGVVGSVRWQTANDDLVCPICGPLNNTEIGIGDKDAMPPAHPRCRCWTKPVVSEEASKRKFSEIFK